MLVHPLCSTSVSFSILFFTIGCGAGSFRKRSLLSRASLMMVCQASSNPLESSRRQVSKQSRIQMRRHRRRRSSNVDVTFHSSSPVWFWLILLFSILMHGGFFELCNHFSLKISTMSLKLHFFVKNSCVYEIFCIKKFKMIKKSMYIYLVCLQRAAIRRQIT